MCAGNVGASPTLAHYYNYFNTNNQHLKYQDSCSQFKTLTGNILAKCVRGEPPHEVFRKTDISKDGDEKAIQLVRYLRVLYAWLH